MILYLFAWLFADVDQSPDDSGIDTDWDSDMVSISSSTYAHQFLQNRRYPILSAAPDGIGSMAWSITHTHYPMTKWKRIG